MEHTPLYLAVPDRRHITPRMNTLRDFLGVQGQAILERSLQASQRRRSPHGSSM